MRYTQRGGNVYAFVMGWARNAKLSALGLNSPQQPGRIARIEILGYKGIVDWKQQEDALRVALPEDKSGQPAVTLKIVLG